MTPNPFLQETDCPLVAIPGERNGYIQLAMACESESYSQVSPELFMAAQAWANILESLGARRIYWITLAEQVRHLHIHLYPRWSDDEPKGIPLFEARFELNQPEWLQDSTVALVQWAEAQRVHLIQ
jgi:diadenosine tetraphosphate (Ap4A) HIT family hydrolase